MNKMNEEYVDNSVYVFEPLIALEMDYIYVPVDYETVKKYYDLPGFCPDEDEVERQYFTKERLEQLKNKLLNQIKETAAEDLFRIICRDTDSGLNYTREQLFDLK